MSREHCPYLAWISGKCQEYHLNRVNRHLKAHVTSIYRSLTVWFNRFGFGGTWRVCHSKPETSTFWNLLPFDIWSWSLRTFLIAGSRRAWRRNITVWPTLSKKLRKGIEIQVRVGIQTYNPWIL